MVLTQQCLNFLHVRFREIGVFLRGNGSRNTGGFTHCEAHGHHTHRALNALSHEMERPATITFFTPCGSKAQ